MTFPIMLAHGVCRFDKIWNQAFGIDNSNDRKLDKFHYFKGIRTHLAEGGFCTYHTNVSWAADVNTRAEDLRRAILKIIARENCSKVNIIAHSMGGLDTRHMLFNDRHKDRIHRQVASLTTISTPHAGSSFADWGTKKFPGLISTAQKIGLNINAIYDLRTDRCRAFNRDPEVVRFEKECSESILFQTYAGKQGLGSVSHILKLPFYIIAKLEGENDGLVSVESAKWHQRYFKASLANTDHLNELGWWEPAQIFCGEGRKALQKRIKRFYLEIAKNLP